MSDDATERELAELYSAHATGMPSQEIDERILRAAHRYVERKRMIWVGVAAAASVVALLAWRNLMDEVPMAARSAGLTSYGYNEGRAAAYLMGEKFYGVGLSETASNMLAGGTPGLSTSETSRR